ncbi:hypothetical protein KBD69_01680 [Candidatus Woesebacteria bacterium]|nr:hypothetical protein [Candidatus Woesebacteria bacterium]
MISSNLPEIPVELKPIFGRDVKRLPTPFDLGTLFGWCASIEFFSDGDPSKISENTTILYELIWNTVDPDRINGGDIHNSDLAALTNLKADSLEQSGRVDLAQRLRVAVKNIVVSQL